MFYLLLIVASLLNIGQSKHFVFLADKGGQGVAGVLMRHAEADRKYINRLLYMDDPNKITVVIGAKDQDLQRVTGFRVERWIAGLAIPDKNLVLVSARGSEIFDARHVFLHELAHIYLHHRVGPHPIPRWFDEGFAMYVSGESFLERIKRVLPAAATGHLIPLRELNRRFPGGPPAVYLAYAESMMFVRYLVHTWGMPVIGLYIDLLAKGVNPDEAFTRAFGVDITFAQKMFERSIAKPSYVLIVLTGSGILWLFISFILLFVYYRKKQHEKELKEKWDREEEEELRDLLSRWNGGPPIGEA